MNAAEFVAKWRQSTLTERSAAHQHYLDLCDLFGFRKPAEEDPTGTWYTFERGVTKLAGGRGFADVWKRGQFAWEYKKRHRDLDAAFAQLLQYAGDLENPPLLVACDMDRIVVLTRFTNYPSTKHEVRLADLEQPKKLDFLRRVFHDHESLRPDKTTREITEEAVRKFSEIARSVRERQDDPTRFAHFLDRLVFCMFAEDAGLLPGKVFSRIFETPNRNPDHIVADLNDLFAKMAVGGSFWGETIRRFNGNLFDDTPALALDPVHYATIKEACAYDWSQMDPSIFGTLFERVMDPAQRSQLGAHYTGFDDIRALVEPVVMAPLRREWAEARDRLVSLLPDMAPAPAAAEFWAAPTPARRAEAQAIADAFLARLRGVRVLDPACGSGNFLYVTLRLLKDLEKAVLAECRHRGLTAPAPAVGPHQLLGIEKNPYAHDLAQMTVWIGDLQWRRDNGFPLDDDPVLRPLDTIRRMDAILDDSDPDFPRIPPWPDAEFIVGNPPFVGYSKLRVQLGHKYVETLFEMYTGRVSNQSDLCCYWFEKARDSIEKGKSKRAGLLATQAIRGGKNREVLNAIKRTGDIFFAQSDRPWVLDGANVHISMVGFDDGSEPRRELDGIVTGLINSNLTNNADVTLARRLAENTGIGFVGGFKFGSFEINDATARSLLSAPNPHALPNSQVLRPWINGLDVLRRREPLWIVDFGEMPQNDAALFEGPFEIVLRRVKPERDEMRRERRKERWWIHGEVAGRLRTSLIGRERYIVTPRVAKHRVFVWVGPEILVDGQLIAFARSDDYFFGVLHSRAHEVWALKLGTRLETRPRYTPTTCFETFPFPEPTEAQRAAIGAAALRLDELRSNWLNPPEWVRREVLEFPGSVDGPWARFVHDPDERGVGTVRYPRLVGKDQFHFDLAKRTLTNLYNERPTWLDEAHRALDAAVFAAYGWPAGLDDDALLARLLDLNLRRASAADAPAPDDAEDA